LTAKKKMMRISLALFFFRLLLLSVIMAWAVNVSGQTKNLAIGGGLGYNLTPHLEYDYNWIRHSWAGNFTPSLTLRYGNKISGVFKASYILNTFEYTEFSQYGGTSNHKKEAYIHQIFCDLLFEHTPSGSKGFYYYLGPGFGIPVKVLLTEEYSAGAWGPNPPVHTYEEYSQPAEFKICINGVIGMGGYIPVKEKNLISFECNFRFGLYKVPVNISYTEHARMIAIQFILGYLRRL
jgi:hypothetical protein